MSTTTPDDVRAVIATDLDDSALSSFIDDAKFRNDEANDADVMDTDHENMLIKYYAAYLVRSVRDRDIASGKRQSVTISYDGSALDELRQRVRELDPSGQLVGQPGVTRRVAGHVGSARPHSRDGIGTLDRREGR